MNDAAATGATTLDAALRAGAARLAALPELARGDSARREAELLLAHVIGCTRANLLAHADATLNPERGAAFGTLIARRAAGEPFAYLTGQRDFWSLTLRVTPAVLVPRPETELVVERALALRDAGPADVVDLGTGSGAIAIACAVERPAWRIVATDASPDALAVAGANARAAGCRNLRCIHGSWYQPLAGARFDLILGNPPYVESGDPALATHGLPFEPQSALASGRDGLDALRAIIADAPAHLRPGGWIVLEHGATQGPAVAKLLEEAGLTHVRCHTDLAGLPRVTEAQKDPAHGTV